MHFMSVPGRGIALCFLIGALSCGTESFRPAPPASPPPVSFGSVVWLDAGASLGFTHRPLKSITVDPRTGSVAVEYVDSLSGWWVTRTDGSRFRRQSGVRLQGGAVSRQGDRLVAGKVGGAGSPVIVYPVTADSLLLDLAVEVASLGYLPRFSGVGDSIVYGRGLPLLGVVVVAVDGTGQRIAVGGITDADWHPTERKLMWAQAESISGVETSLILEFDLGTGAVDTLLRSHTDGFRHPQYSPDGQSVAYGRSPNGGSEPLQLWVGSRQSLQGTRVTQSPILDDYAWRPDSKAIAYIRYDITNYSVSNSAVAIFDIQTGRTTVIATGERVN